MQTFHHPTTRLLRRLQIAARLHFSLLRQLGMCRSIVLIGTNMRHILMCLYRFIHGLVIIASVQAEMLWCFLGGSRTCNHDALQGCLNELHVIAVGTSNHHGQRHAASVTQLAAFGSPLAAIGGIGTGRGSTERGGWLITPSMLCHCQATPSSSSYSCNPACQMRSNTPCCSPSAGSDRRRWCWLPVLAAGHSIGYPCAAHTRWLRASADRSEQAALLSDALGALGSTVARVPTLHHLVPRVWFVSLTFFSVPFSFHSITGFRISSNTTAALMQRASLLGV